MLAGVCGGIGEYVDIDPTAVRVLWLVVTLVMAPIMGTIAYIAVTFIIPEEQSMRPLP